MNIGERDELIAILKFIDLKRNKGLFDGKEIKTIYCGDVSCIDLPTDFSVSKLIHLNDDELKHIARTCGVKKAPSNSKADIQINSVSISIKSNRSAPPAIVNHTSRPGFENVCRKVSVDIKFLDSLIAEYWRMRKARLIKEDVKNTDKNSPFKEHKEFFKPLLNYFLFKGTGSRESIYPAQLILTLTDPLDPKTWEVLNEEAALDKYWEKLVFSLRAKKGMPEGYPDNMSKKANLFKSSVDIWTEYINGDYRGALHVRALK
jgi:hypothetical protein